MSKTILLNHGSGGRMMSELIKNNFIKSYGNELLNQQSDSSVLTIDDSLIAFTTDSYVVDPIFFPGGDIGKLAICGTVNDLAVSGAKPLYISVSFIIEEGFTMENLHKIVQSISNESKKANIKIVTGDTKVVNKGKCDKIFINTTGIGLLKKEYKAISTGEDIEPGDQILLNGYLGDHAITILGARENISFEKRIESDCTSLNNLIAIMLNEGINIKFMRDITRGGLATILAEITENKNYGIEIDEEAIPIREIVAGTCEIFGFDPLYLANEGKVIFIIDNKDSKRALDVLKKHNDGRNSAIIGETTNQHQGKAILNSIIGGKRILDKLAGEQLPRIC